MVLVEFLSSSIEAYIDDMLVKSIWVEAHKDHLLQSFEVLDKY